MEWERHTEFVRYTSIMPDAAEDLFTDPAIAAVPPEWLAALPGQLMVASQVALLPADPADMDPLATAARLFPRQVLVGSGVSSGAAVAFTAAMVTADDPDEPELLDRLTRLAAEIDSRQSDNLYRFSAAFAYDDLVTRRIEELRLQSTVEGLSIAAVTHYIQGAVGYAAMTACIRLDAELAQGISVPFIAGLMYYWLRQIRRGLVHD